MIDLGIKHCDDYIDDETQDYRLRRFLYWARLPAICKYPAPPKYDYLMDPELRPYIWRQPEPKLFADYQGQRVRVLVASRFGDVGITTDLSADHGYQKRVAVAELSNFGDQR